MVHPPAWLATAIDVVLRAGEIQMRHLGGDLQIDKKGPIDLVTRVDLEVERMCRDTIAERFPGHGVLAEELENETDRAGVRHRWVFDPVDGTVNYAHGLPIFCSCLALEVDGRPEVAAVFDPTRRELFTADRGVGAWLNGAPLRVSDADAVLNALLCTGFPYDVHETVDEVVGTVRRLRGAGACGAAPRVRRARPLLRGRWSVRRVLGAAAASMGSVGRQSGGRGVRGPGVPVRRHVLRHAVRTDRRVERSDS